MCDEQVHTHCLPFFKVSSVFVKMTTNKKHKFQFRKKATAKIRKEKNNKNIQTKRDERKERRTPQTLRHDNISF